MIDDTRPTPRKPEASPESQIARLCAALQNLLSFDAIQEAQDMGPVGAGWKSDELSRAIAEAEAAWRECSISTGASE